MITIDFSQKFERNDGYIDWTKIIVYHISSAYPEVIKIRKYHNGTYDYFSDEYWLQSDDDQPFTEEFTLEQLNNPKDINAFWQHP